MSLRNEWYEIMSIKAKIICSKIKKESIQIVKPINYSYFCSLNFLGGDSIIYFAMLMIIISRPNMAKNVNMHLILFSMW